MAQEFLKAPAAQSVRLIEFDEARVVPGFVTNTWILIVSGTKPYLNMKVRLQPLIYKKQPVYWGIEVTGTLCGIGLPTTAPYTESLPLDGVIGTKGIEVIGANKSQKIPVPPKSK